MRVLNVNHQSTVKDDYGKGEKDIAPILKLMWRCNSWVSFDARPNRLISKCGHSRRVNEQASDRRQKPLLIITYSESSSVRETNDLAAAAAECDPICYANLQTRHAAVPRRSQITFT